MAPLNFSHDPLFEALFNAQSPRLLLKADAPAFTILADNDGHKEMTNTKDRIIVGKSLWEVFDPEASAGGGEIFSNALMKAIETKNRVFLSPFRYDIPSQSGEFEIKWWNGEILPITGADENVACLLINSNDVTRDIVVGKEVVDAQQREQVLNEKLEASNEELTTTVEELRQSQEELEKLNTDLENQVTRRTDELQKFKFLADYAEDAFILMRDDGTFAYLNIKAKERWGYSDEEIFSMSVPDIDPMVSEKRFFEIFDLAQTESIPVFETIHKRKNGSNFPVEINLRGLLIAGKPYVFALARDITKRKKIQEALRESEERLNLAVVNSDAGVFDTNLRTEKTIRSVKHAQIYGYKDNQGEWTLDKVREHILPEDYDAGNQAYLESLKTGILNHNFRIKRADDVIRWINTTGKVVYDENNEPFRIIGTVTDITEKKKMERQKDEFISTVSHELKTPVTSIKAYNQFLQRALKQTGETQNIHFLERMDVQIDRLQALIQGLLDITRIEQKKLSLKQVSLSLTDLVAEVAEDLQVILPTHKLIIDCQADVVVMGDKNRLIQVVTNLINNAVKYSPDSTEVLIGLKQDAGKAVFSIQDFGIGIKKENRTLVFERFHQANNLDSQAGLSLGLGLYISKEIITGLGGELWFESEIGKGSTFYFSLPLSV